MTTTWTALAGDTSAFAIEVSFLTDPDSHHYDADERESWGALTLWVNGVNVTEHIEQGEVLRSAHWYLLPTVEWFVRNWDALFHEERLPLSNAGDHAAAAMTRLLIQPLRLVRADLSEFERLETWQAWWARHNLVDSVAGGIYPDVYLRRWGDLVEISVGAAVAAGTPSHFRYQNVNVVGRVPVGLVASSVFDVLYRAVAELRRRRPESPRLNELARAVDDVTDVRAERYMRRLALLSGVDVAREGALDDFVTLWNGVDAALGGELDSDAREIVLGHPHRGPVLETAPQVALLFGSYSPMMTADDVQVLVRSLHQALSRIRSVDLPCLGHPTLPDLSPGQEGSELGEIAYRELADQHSSYVDIDAILGSLGVTYSMDRLSDQNTRAISLLSGRYGVHIVVNRNYLRGTTERVLRFTLAHELGHILLDRSRSLQMAIVSGPWAPRAVEQRANAFAAALLMPEELIARYTQTLDLPLWKRVAAQRVAASLRVSVSSLADRMYNLMLVSREEADNITDTSGQ